MDYANPQALASTQWLAQNLDAEHHQIEQIQIHGPSLGDLVNGGKGGPTACLQDGAWGGGPSSQHLTILANRDHTPGDFPSQRGRDV